MLKLSCFHQP